MTDHVIDAIDAALRDWETSDDAMRCSYADPLPPVEERDVPPSSAGVDVSGWRAIGYIFDVPDAFLRPEGVKAGTYANARADMAEASDYLHDQVQFDHEAWVSMLLYGEVFIERPYDGRGWGRTGRFPRVVRRNRGTGPQRDPHRHRGL